MNPNQKLNLLSVVAIVIGATALSGCASQTATNPANIIVTSKYGTIGTEDLEADTLRLDEAEKKRFRSSPQLMAQIMDNLQVYQGLVKQAIDSGYGKQPDVQLSGEQAKMRHLGTLYLNKRVADDLAVAGDFSEAAREVYAANREKFAIKESVDAQHILIGLEGRDDAAAFARATAAQAELKAGASFDAMVEKYSDDPGSKTKRGELPKLARGQTVAAFESAAFALRKSGELSEIVKTPFGYHIIRLLEYTAPGTKPFSEVKADIEADLKNKRSNALRDRIIQEIRAEPSIKITDEVFERFTGEKRIKK